MIGFDPQPEMVQFVREQAQQEGLEIDVFEGVLAFFRMTETVDAAMCLMDTFRFLLTSEEIIAHLRAVADHLTPGGLYVLDFWVPGRWDATANGIYQWEQEADGVHRHRDGHEEDEDDGLGSRQLIDVADARPRGAGERGGSAAPAPTGCRA